MVVLRDQLLLFLDETWNHGSMNLFLIFGCEASFFGWLYYWLLVNLFEPICVLVLLWSCELQICHLFLNGELIEVLAGHCVVLASVH